MSLIKSKFSNILKRINNSYYDCVVLDLGRIKLSFNINEINYDIFEVRDLKISIINYYIDNLSINKSYKYHLFNHLFVNKNSIHKLACLINFLNKKNLNIKRIYATFLSKNDEYLFRKFNLRIRKLKLNHFKLNTLQMLFLVISRYFFYKKEINYFPRKDFYDKNTTYTKLLRAWVDLAENLYVNKLKNTLGDTVIHVNPGYIGELPSKRQEKYIEHLQKEKLNYFFYVLKLKIWNMLFNAFKLIFYSYPKDAKKSLLAIIIQRKEIEDYVNYITQKFPFMHTFYTKEEFIPSTIYLTEKLHEKDIKVINLAHGVGTYCPYVNFDEFYLFSKTQKEWYFGPTKFKYYELELSPVNSNKRMKKKFALLFISQNIITMVPSPSLNSYYREILKYIENLYEDLQIPIFVKYHPNSKEKDKIFSKNIISVNEIEDLPKEYNYLSITYFSTYVIELLHKMPFIYVNPEEKTNLKYFFPSDDILCAKSYQDFKNKMRKFIENPDYYYEFWNKEIEIINDNLS